MISGNGKDGNFSIVRRNYRRIESVRPSGKKYTHVFFNGFPLFAVHPNAVDSFVDRVALDIILRDLFNGAFRMLQFYQPTLSLHTRPTFARTVLGADATWRRNEPHNRTPPPPDSVIKHEHGVVVQPCVNGTRKARVVLSACDGRRFVNSNHVEIITTHTRGRSI